MATFGTLNEPYVQGALASIEPIALGDLITVGGVTDVLGVGAPIQNRFPIPPSAYGFLVDIEGDTPDVDGPDRVITSALNPESIYLEPTTGQIWPR